MSGLVMVKNVLPNWREDQEPHLLPQAAGSVVSFRQERKVRTLFSPCHRVTEQVSRPRSVTLGGRNLHREIGRCSHP